MKREKGFALIFVFVIVSLITLAAVAFAVIAMNEILLAKTTADGIRAHYLAEAGLAKKFMELRSGDTGNITNETFTFATGDTGTFSVTVTLLSPTPFASYQLEATGRYKNAMRRLAFTARQMSFARYAYFSNNENDLYWHRRRPIWFVTGDNITGPLHTNSSLNISGDPTFDGPVSTAGSSINYYHGGPPEDNPDFRQSLTLGVPTVSFPIATSEIVTNLKTNAQDTAAGGVYLSGTSSIVLLPDGTMSVTNSTNNWVNHSMPIPTNNALFVQGGDANVSGILQGQLTIGASGNVVVTNNITYNTDPRIDPASTDMLGLVSQNNVVVSASAPYDLEIDAYVVALKDASGAHDHSFTVENYWDELKGTLTLYGGVTQDVRGPVGTFDPAEDERVSGYQKDYHYDERLQNMTPCYFPPAKDSNNRILYRKLTWVEQ